MATTKLEDCDSDPHTQSDLTAFRVEHVHLVWDVDVANHCVRGSAELRCRVLRETSELLFDTAELSVRAVSIDGAAAAHKLRAAVPVFGSALEVHAAAPLAADAVVRVTVEYETSPQASGIQWLAPSQTEGKTHPYMFTQFQAIHARSAFPCQDSPAVKQSYTAAVTVPRPLVALMSALQRGSEDCGSDRVTYRFEQPVPIPSYLFALAVGELVSRTIGPRTKVWCEPSRADEAAWEFDETEAYLRTAEEILTPYEFGQYDILCLPGSFPYGGMENPCMTFVTPTLLAGDRSLSDVVAHEITHSWCGNLVTNRTWQHFWLNEGFTVFVERKIQQRLHGEPMRHFGFLVHNKDLRDCVEGFGEADKGFTCLVQNQQGRDPDDAFSSVPYERGAQFLFYLEHVVGGADVFEPFLKAYVREFRLRTLNSGELKRFFLQYFHALAGFDVSRLNAIDWDAWFYGTGMPPVDMVALFDRSLLDRAQNLASSWNEHGRASGDVYRARFTAADLEGWSSHQTIAFLSALLEMTAASASGPLPVHALEHMETAYSLMSSSRNSEIRFRWCMLNVQAGRAAVYDNALAFLGLVGRMKYVRPLYRALFNHPNSKEIALSTFEKHRSFYHNICAKMVARDLGK